jgi:hypothetical protein|tara:strand:- start:50 stop:346 length:297 start_codon:yes stop_codon:yes gene_type:complete
MAFKMNIPLPGGIEHADGYVRVTDCRVCKKDDTSDWFMMVDVAVYKDADARGAASPVRISAPAIDKFKFAYAVSDGASPADAYAKLKTLDLFSSATDV